MTPMFAHLTFTGTGPWSMKMDQSWIVSLLEKSGIWCAPLDRVLRTGGVLVLQAEPNKAYRNAVLDVIRRMPWCVLIATSDEAAEYEWLESDGDLPNVKFWIQSPRPENPYPRGSRFFGIGCPRHYDISSPAVPLASERPVDAAFRGQMQNLLRLAAVDGLTDARIAGRNVVNHVTEGFLQGLSRDEYLAELETAKVAVCPAGSTTQDTFRLYEALEAGCIPIVDMLRADDGGAGFWEMIGMNWLYQNCYGWHLLPEWLDSILDGDINMDQALHQAKWASYQADVAARILEDVESASGKAFT